MRPSFRYGQSRNLIPQLKDLTCSALTGEGVREIWQMVLDRQEQLGASGYIAARRSRQNLE